MRILHMVASISPESGGPTEVIRMLIRNAPPTDTAEVVTLDDPTAPFLSDLPFKVHALGSPKKRWYSPRLLPWLRANRHRFDAALIHGLWQYPGLAARLTLKGHLPYAVFPHGMLDPYFKRDRLKHLKKQLYWVLAESWVLRSAHRVLFTTPRERDLAQNTFWPSRWNPTITPLGTEPPTADTATLLAAFYQRCPELKDKRFLLYLGRIDPKKGCDLLINAFVESKHAAKPEMMQAGPALKGPGLSPAITTPSSNGALAPEGAEAHAIHLLMAGPDPNGWRHDLETSVLLDTNFDIDRLYFPGLLTGPAKWGALAACDAFILPSHQENFGIAVVEALASGKPVLISDQVNIAPEIEADDCGLVEPDTLDGTRRLLQRWLALTPDERAAMSTRARTTFATRYDMRHNTAAILDIFRAEAH